MAFLGLVAAYVAAGLPLQYLKPRRLDELGSGLVSGSQALSTAQLPYVGADPWPGRVLELLGAELVMVAALLAFWPRPVGHPGRGYPFLALSALLVVAASPVVSLGGTRPLLLGLGLTLLTVCFLWLERLPLRPGLGVAALVGVALAGAVPLAAAADRGEPWFDYQSFAEGFSPKDPISFDWEHGDYGPMTWTRTGAEVIRVKADRPAYWKVRTLADFDGHALGRRALRRAGGRVARPPRGLGDAAAQPGRDPGQRAADARRPTSSARARRGRSPSPRGGSCPRPGRGSGSRSATCGRATPTRRRCSCRGRRRTSWPPSSRRRRPSTTTR